MLAQLKHVIEAPKASKADHDKATALRTGLGAPVHYAPLWVRMLSAFCLSAGTMVCHKRVVQTLGEKFGSSHMAPGPGLSAELVGSVLIGTAGSPTCP